MSQNRQFCWVVTETYDSDTETFVFKDLEKAQKYIRESSETVYNDLESIGYKPELLIHDENSRSILVPNSAIFNYDWDIDRAGCMTE